MAVLVEYRCPACGARTERWAAHPVPALADCARCAQPARRRFGGALLAAGGSTGPPSDPVGDGGGCAEVSGVPGTCTLVPTAARMLAARARRDGRALEREVARQETAIAAGTLDPSGPLTTTFAGGPTVSAE